MATPNGGGNYFDILLLGRSGLGKTTTAKKLLQFVPGSTNSQNFFNEWVKFDSATCVNSSQDANAAYNSGVKIDQCILASNQTIRVLDTPSFTDSLYSDEYGGFCGNLRILESIRRAQDTYNLEFRRVLYFLPHRGPLERADGTLQEELQVIHGFLGEEVFKVMVIIATNYYKKGKAEEVIDDDDIKITKAVFMVALEEITNTANSQEKVVDQCPPIVYLPFLENDVEKIVKIPVLSGKPLKKPIVIEFSESFPATTSHIQNLYQRHKGCKLQFHDRCTKCSSMVVYSETQSGRFPSRVIVNEKSEAEHMIAYNNSKCHPQVRPRYSTVWKVTGGVVHIITIGLTFLLGYICGTKILPFFCDDEYICTSCNKNPNTEPCLGINELFRVKTDSGVQDIPTSHSTKLEKLLVQKSDILV